MLTETIRKKPISCFKIGSNFRSKIEQCIATQAELGGKIFANFFKERAMFNGLVRKLISAGRSTHLTYGFHHVDFGQPVDIDATMWGDISQIEIISIDNAPVWLTSICSLHSNARKSKRIVFAFQFTFIEQNSTKVFLATVAQVRAFLLKSRSSQKATIALPSAPFTSQSEDWVFSEKK